MVAEIKQHKHASKKPCWVIKIGSALLTADGLGLDETAIASWVQQMASLHQRGISVVLVSSGAVAAGMQLSLIHISEPTRPTATSRMPSSA